MNSSIKNIFKIHTKPCFFNCNFEPNLWKMPGLFPKIVQILVFCKFIYSFCELVKISDFPFFINTNSEETKNSSNLRTCSRFASLFCRWESESCEIWRCACMDWAERSIFCLSCCLRSCCCSVNDSVSDSAPQLGARTAASHAGCGCTNTQNYMYVSQ